MNLTCKLLIFGLAISCYTFGQDINFQIKKDYKIVFYNVENMFDTIFDPNSEINTFYSGGDINWNSYKYNNKLKNIYKSIRSLAGWDSLLLVGLAEVENQKVIEDLINLTPLRNHDLDYCHFDSKDKRGIDVALLYNNKALSESFCMTIPVYDENDSSFRTRDILYFQGMFNNEKLHVFVVHWTSRYRGFMASEEKRMICSDVLYHCMDTIFKKYNRPKMIVMGDFNDEVKNKSIVALAKKLKNDISVMPSKPYNKVAGGTLKYRSEWYNFDHFIVSRSLFINTDNVILDTISWIYDAGFLMEDDNKYLGKKPFRTNIGYKYNGGFSDHLPVFLRLSVINK